MVCTLMDAIDEWCFRIILLLIKIIKIITVVSATMFIVLSLLQSRYKSSLGLCDEYGTEYA